LYRERFHSIKVFIRSIAWLCVEKVVRSLAKKNRLSACEEAHRVLYCDMKVAVRVANKNGLLNEIVVTKN